MKRVLFPAVAVVALVVALAFAAPKGRDFPPLKKDSPEAVRKFYTKCIEAYPQALREAREDVEQARRSLNDAKRRRVDTSDRESRLQRSEIFYEALKAKKTLPLLEMKTLALGEAGTSRFMRVAQVIDNDRVMVRHGFFVKTGENAASLFGQRELIINRTGAFKDVVNDAFVEVIDGFMLVTGTDRELTGSTVFAAQFHKWEDFLDVSDKP